MPLGTRSVAALLALLAIPFIGAVPSASSFAYRGDPESHDSRTKPSSETLLSVDSLVHANHSSALQNDIKPARVQGPSVQRRRKENGAKFSVTQVKNKEYPGRSGPKAMIKAYQKYMAVPPSSLTQGTPVESTNNNTQKCE